jgi:membrane-bound lytic murein transglycosylase MltF
MKALLEGILALNLIIVSNLVLAQTNKTPEIWSGSYSEMIERGEIRVAAPYDRTIYVSDKGVQRGLALEVSKGLAKWINAKYVGQMKGKPISIKLVPVIAPDLLNSLTSGRADITIGDIGLYEPIPNSQDFIVNHASRDGQEVLVTGPSSPPLLKIADLSGQTVYGSRNTNFQKTFSSLNKELKRDGKLPINLASPLGDLDDEDLLEMLNSGLISYVTVGDWKFRLWQSIYKNITMHAGLSVQDSGWVGWAVRSTNRDLNDDLKDFYASDDFVKSLTAFRQEEYKQHLKGLKDPIDKTVWTRFESMRPLFNRFGAQYKLNPLVLAALGFQETLLNQSAVSSVGAIGVMQLMPATGMSLGVGDIHLLEPNIHGGADYMNQLISKYFPDAQFEGNNRSLFAVASYNIGPNNVAKARNRAKELGFDPNRWFGNVEFIATEHMGYEPMIYVRNVYKYYISYRLKLKEIQSIQP